MKAVASALSTGQATILGVVVIGCATAAVITGHISGGDFLAVVGGVGVVGGTVTTAHVVGTQVNTAAAGSTMAPVPPATSDAPPIAATGAGGTTGPTGPVAAMPGPGPAGGV